MVSLIVESLTHRQNHMNASDNRDYALTEPASWPFPTNGFGSLCLCMRRRAANV